MYNQQSESLLFSAVLNFSFKNNQKTVKK